ncbi:MAG: hypothetical protein WC891_07425 [Actinomycetota bacterium]
MTVAESLGLTTLSSWQKYRTMPPTRFVVISLALSVVGAAAAGCALFPSTSLTDLDIPAVAGTEYTVYQNPVDESVSVSFTKDGPWDFTEGPTGINVKSRLVKKTAAAAYKKFVEAKYAEKVLPSAFTNDFTTYNFAAITQSSLNSYGQSVTPGPDGPMVKTYDKPERLLKFPVNVGDEWTDTITTTEQPPVVFELNRKVVARGQVKVPAGSFFNCFMVRLIRTAKTTDETQPTRTIMYFWWAPDVGLVAAVGSQPDETEMFFRQADYIIRLKSYKIGE